MTAVSKSWFLGAGVAINGLLGPALVFTWVQIYQEYSYPIDFFMPIARMETRATLSLCVAAVSVPLGFLLYVRSARDLHSLGRIVSLTITSIAACVAISFAVWRFT